MARNYRKEYDSYHKKPRQKKRRAKRNLARSIRTRLKLVHKGDGKDIDHKDRNPNNTSRKNLRVQSKKKNRGRNK